MKRTHDDHLRDLETNAREDEYSKYYSCIHGVEVKIMTLEE